MTGNPGGQTTASLDRLTTLHPQLLGLLRMGVLVIDDQDRVTHCSRAASHLFGRAPRAVVGRRLADILGRPPARRHVFEPSRSDAGAPWSGVCDVTHGRTVTTAAWWVFPLDGVGSARRLVLVADARRLTELGPGLAVGDHVPLVPPEGERDPGVRILRVEPAIAAVPRGDRETFRRNLVEILPLTGPDRSERIVRQVLDRGYPALDVTATTRLWFAPYWSEAGQATGSPLPAGTDGARLEQGPPRESMLEMAAARERLAFLNEASTRIGTTLDLAKTIDELSRVLVPYFADFAGVQLLDQIVAKGEMPSRSATASALLRRVSAVHNDEPGRWDDVIPLDEVLRLPPDTPFVRCMVTGKPVCVPHVDAETGDAISASFDDRDLRPLLRERSLLIVPLTARGGSVIGNFVLSRKPDRTAFDDMDIGTAEELARRAALSMDNACIYRREAEAADTLQRSMRPEAPPSMAGVEVSYRYLPGSKDAQVGGDWFDVIRLPGSRVAFVVGDVMGHGLKSASVMGQFRTCVRTLAALDLPPEQVLRHLDDLAQRLGENYLATCLYAVYDPVARRCEAANAGHIPPVLVGPDGRSDLLELPPGAPIGVGGVAFEAVRFEIPDGSELVLCTDGLIEVRGRDIGIGLTRLCASLAGPARPLDEACDSIINALHTEDRQDDVALLMARFYGIPLEDVAWWSPGAGPDVVRDARAFARDALASWGLDTLGDAVELLVSELVTNAVRHADGPTQMRLLRADTLLCEVSDATTSLPALREVSGEAEYGWGLHLVSRLAKAWGSSRTPTGKVVWFEYPLRP
ncbi:MAG: SpoIIE family protein phosphatase [Streptosporangiaceae bacterium]